MRKVFYALSLMLIGLVLISLQANACTGIQLTAKNGDIVYARTMEWGPFDLHSRIAIIPRGYEFTSITPDGENGKKFKAKYGFVGLDILYQNYIADGMNEKGLTMGMFYHPGCAEYAPYDANNAENSVAAQQFCNFILSQFSTVQEVIDGIENIDIIGIVEKSLGIVADCHWKVTDASGRVIVIECTNNKTKIYDAPLGVITNAPNYDWHLTNIRNYINMSMFSVPAKELSGLKFSATGVGSGFLGLPGDYTPPSRFIRAVAWTQAARSVPDGEEGIYEAFRILDSFQLPATPAIEGAPESKEFMRSATQWTTAWNLAEKTLNYHTQDNRRVRQIKLTDIDFAKMGKDIVIIPLEKNKEEDVLDVTPKL